MIAAPLSQDRIRRFLAQFEVPEEPTVTEFSPTLQPAIIAYMLEVPDHGKRIAPTLRPELFTGLPTRYVVAWLLNLFHDIGEIPTREALWDQISRDLTVDTPNYEEVYQLVWRKADPRDTTIIKKQLDQWRLRQSYARLYDAETLDAYEARDYSCLDQIFEDCQAAKLGSEDPHKNLKTGEELLAMTFDDTDKWLVEGVMMPGKMGVIAGPLKTLKTAIATDLALSLATGASFLGEFRVPTPRKVLFLAGESDDQEMQGRVRRVLRSKKKGNRSSPL